MHGYYQVKEEIDIYLMDYLDRRDLIERLTIVYMGWRANERNFHDFPLD